MKPQISILCLSTVIRKLATKTSEDFVKLHEISEDFTRLKRLHETLRLKQSIDPFLLNDTAYQTNLHIFKI